MATLTADGGGNTRGTTVRAYDAAGNLTSETSPLGFVTRYTYDKEGHALTKVDANGKTTSYDAVGNVLAVTDALSGAVRYTYDVRNRVVSVTDKLGAATVLAYDAAGNATRRQIAYT